LTKYFKKEKRVEKYLGGSDGYKRPWALEEFVCEAATRAVAVKTTKIAAKS